MTGAALLLSDNIPAATFIAGFVLGLMAGRAKRRVAEIRARDAEDALAESLRVNVELAQKFNTLRFKDIT